MNPIVKDIGLVAGVFVSGMAVYEAGKRTVFKRYFKKNGNVKSAECDIRHNEVQRRLNDGDTHFKVLDKRTKTTNREIKYTKMLLLEIVSPKQQKEAERKYNALIAEEGDE